MKISCCRSITMLTLTSCSAHKVELKTFSRQCQCQKNGNHSLFVMSPCHRWPVNLLMHLFAVESVVTYTLDTQNEPLWGAVIKDPGLSSDSFGQNMSAGPVPATTYACLTCTDNLISEDKQWTEVWEGKGIWDCVEPSNDSVKDVRWHTQDVRVFAAKTDVVLFPVKFERKNLFIIKVGGRCAYKVAVRLRFQVLKSTACMTNQPSLPLTCTMYLIYHSWNLAIHTAQLMIRKNGSLYNTYANVCLQAGARSRSRLNLAVTSRLKLPDSSFQTFCKVGCSPRCTSRICYDFTFRKLLPACCLLYQAVYVLLGEFWKCTIQIIWYDHKFNTL